jgi:hypothetical protein
MSTTTHPVAPEELMAFLDGELSTERAQAVTEHLEQCESCGALASEFRAQSKEFIGWETSPIPERLSKRVGELAGKIRSGQRVPHASLFVRTSLWGGKKWVALATASAFSLLLLLAIATPNLMRPRMTANDMAAASRTRTVQHVFESKNGDIEVAGEPKLQSSDVNGDSLATLAKREKSFSVDGQPRSGKDTALSEAFATPMIARTVSISVVVKDFTAARANLDAILRRHHGYAANLTANTAENAPRSIEASLRVPAPELDAALADLKALGNVQRESQNGEEVTQQHADLVARLKNSRETEQRLQAILAQRTGKVKDVLEVEQEIARVRGEIEQMEAEQKSLEHRVDFATVNLSLAEEFKAQLLPPAISTGTRLHNALIEGYRSATETLLGIVLFFAEYTLTLLIWGVILLLPVLLLWKRYRRSLAAA